MRASLCRVAAAPGARHEAACWSHASIRAPPRAPAVDRPRPRRPGRRAGGRAGRIGLPGGLARVPHLSRDGRGHPPGRRGPPRHRPPGLDRPELPGPPAVGGEGQRQRQRRRERARGPVRRRPPLRRAHGPRDDPAHPPLARGRLRQGRARHEHRQHARGLDRLRDEPRRGDLRHQERALPLLAQEPAADPGLVLDRHRPQPQLRLPLGPRRADQPQPPGDHVSRPEALLGARDARVSRLPRLARRRRAAADPGRDHVPRGRAPRDVAVRLHEEERPGRHDRPGPGGAEPDRPPHGEDERLQARAGERPVHQRRHVARLPLRHLPDVLVHVRDVEPRLPQVVVHRARDRPQPRGRPLPRRARVVPALGPRGGRPRGTLRGVRRRPRGRPRLAGQPRRHRHRDDHDAGPLGPRQPGRDEDGRRDAAAHRRPVRAIRLRDRAGRRLVGRGRRPRRADDDPLGADHAAGGRRPEADLQLDVRARGELVVGGPPARDRPGRARRRPSCSSGPGPRPSSGARGTGRRSRWTPGPARPSRSGSRRSTARRRRRSRPGSTTCG